MNTDCTICGNSIDQWFDMFEVPRLPDRYGLGELHGIVHRRCLQEHARADAFRSALARSLAAVSHEPPRTWIAGVETDLIWFRVGETRQSTLWDLQGFLVLPFIDEALERLRNLSPGDVVHLDAGGQRTIECLDDGRLRLQEMDDSCEPEYVTVGALRLLLSGLGGSNARRLALSVASPDRDIVWANLSSEPEPVPFWIQAAPPARDSRGRPVTTVRNGARDGVLVPLDSRTGTDLVDQAVRMFDAGYAPPVSQAGAAK